MATPGSATIVKFADNNVMVVLISDSDERVYLEEIKQLKKWCQDSKLLLSVSKRKSCWWTAAKSRSGAFSLFSGAPVNIRDIFKYLGVHATQAS